ncbi:conserved hypothetical protein [Hahella chejuensis KCTC 2396]|uniref:Uncharacterized protein n=1 Tax=Hahella chejuensis (strain KCTC 2396) TaxID=349521 RepID=Q2SAM5_HAHCH|nr:hypothetical protein [Hahella chejuensis]ABC32299.1 conserved hypothetical protein [Hahella chejuensis KCTC 2396]
MKTVNECVQWLVILIILYVLLFKIDFDFLKSAPKRVPQTEERLSQQEERLNSLKNKMEEIQTQVDQINQKISTIEKKSDTTEKNENLEKIRIDLSSLKYQMDLLSDKIQQQVKSEKNIETTSLNKVENGVEIGAVAQWTKNNIFIVGISLSLLLFALIHSIVKRKRRQLADVAPLNFVKSHSNKDRECA